MYIYNTTETIYIKFIIKGRLHQRHLTLRAT